MPSSDSSDSDWISIFVSVAVGVKNFELRVPYELTRNALFT